MATAWGQILGTRGGSLGAPQGRSSTSTTGGAKRHKHSKTRREARWDRPAAKGSSLHGKEGVDGSSPSEGSAKTPQNRASSFGRTCKDSSMQWVWSRFWSFQVQDGSPEDMKSCSLPRRQLGLSRRSKSARPMSSRHSSNCSHGRFERTCERDHELEGRSRTVGGEAANLRGRILKGSKTWFMRR